MGTKQKNYDYGRKNKIDSFHIHEAASRRIENFSGNGAMRISRIFLRCGNQAWGNYVLHRKPIGDQDCVFRASVVIRPLFITGIMIAMEAS